MGRQGRRIDDGSVIAHPGGSVFQPVKDTIGIHFEYFSQAILMTRLREHKIVPGHNTGIIDDDIQLLPFYFQAVKKVCDRLFPRNVERNKLCADSGGSLSRIGDISNDDLGASSAESFSYRKSYAFCRSGYQRRLAVK